MNIMEYLIGLRDMQGAQRRKKERMRVASSPGQNAKLSTRKRKRLMQEASRRQNRKG